MAKIARITGQKAPNWSTVPAPHMADGLRLYYERGLMPGSFMRAILSNDLAVAIRLGDTVNRHIIGEWVLWIAENLDPRSHGSPEKVEAWVRRVQDPQAAELNEVNAAIDALEEQLDALEQKRAGLQGKTKVRCESNHAYGKGCGEEFEIGTLTYIATHWYVRPHGCTGGDYWREGEGNFICPSCGHRNRFYDRKHYEKLKDRFAKVVNEHDAAS